MENRNPPGPMVGADRCSPLGCRARVRSASGVFGAHLATPSVHESPSRVCALRTLWLRPPRHARAVPGMRGGADQTGDYFKLTHYRFVASAALDVTSERHVTK